MSMQTLERVSDDRHSENLRRFNDIERQVSSLNTRLWLALVGIIGILIQGLHLFR
jgi:hypothetical protein